MKLTNTMNLPQPFVSAAESDHRYTPKRYSATALLKGVRQCILERRHDDEITEDVSDMVWAIFGTAVHGILEAGQETETQLKENKLVVDMPNGYQLSGIFDLYVESTGTVTDYKTASVWKVNFGEKDPAQFDDWRKQTLIYCWMLRQIGFEAKRGEIVALLKDHSKTKAKIGEHPAHPVYRIGWDFSDEQIAECGEWLKARFEEIAAAEQLPDEQLPMCTKEERWGKDDKWAVKKKGNKRAAKLHDSEAEAIADAKARSEKEGKPYEVEHRPGTDSRCMDYCSACQFCDHYKKLTEVQ